MSAGEIIIAIMLAAASYMAGSIPFGVVVARLTGAQDPRVIAAYLGGTAGAGV